MKALRSIARGFVLMVSLLAGVAGAVTIETVPVNDAGNVADTEVMWDGTTGYGSVGYVYSIGKYEVTAGQYTAFLNAVAGVDTYALYSLGMASTSYGSGISRSGGGTLADPYTYSVASDFANRPVNYVSYWDACRFTNWLHNGQPMGAQGSDTTERGAYTLDGYNGPFGATIHRNAGALWALPSEDEWYKAAYYKGGSANAGYWDYPTSSDTLPGRDMADPSGNNANYYGVPSPIDSGKYTTLVGEFQNSPSPYGTFDQGGNLWEWNEFTFASYGRGLRGGALNNPGDTLHASYRSGDWPDDYPTKAHEGAIGFRVVEVPEPGTLVTLALGGAAALRRKKT